MTKNLKELEKFLSLHPEVLVLFMSSNFFMFTILCMSHLFSYKLGVLQLLMTHDAGSDTRHLVYPTFPDSYAKEIFAVSYILWCVLGKKNHTNCVVVCGTHEQAKELYEKVLSELVDNEELRVFNHGVQEHDGDGWNIFVKNKNARISFLVYPAEPEKIRHMRKRPDVVIAYELEDSEDTVSRIHNWLGEKFYDVQRYYQKTILIGTVASRNNIFYKLKNESFRRKIKLNPSHPILIMPCPLFTKDNICLWEERYSPKEQKSLIEKEGYTFHTEHQFKIPKRFITKDGYDTEGFMKYLYDIQDLFTAVSYQTCLENPAEEYSLCGGEYTYYGFGSVITYIPIDD